MAIVTSGHIEVDDQGVARIAGRPTKVIQIVMDKLAHGWNADEIQTQHPHLSLAQVHAAFAYYYDHQTECDRQIQASADFADAMRAAAGPSPLVDRLRAEGKVSLVANQVAHGFVP